MFEKIDHINMQVKNLQESSAFYAKFFGLEVKESGVGMRGNPYQIVGKNDFALCMYEHPSLNREKISNSPFDHFGIRINDQEKFLKLVETEKIKINYGGVVEYNASNSWYIEDPNGYEIEVSFAKEQGIAFNG